MKMMVIIPILLAATACGTKSYTYEVAFQVEGSGQAELTMKFPGSPNGVTETRDLPTTSTFVAEGLGPVSLVAKGTNEAVTCKIVLEKHEVAKNTGTTATCESSITEDTEN